MTIGVDCIPADPAATIWDVVVIGTGAGGATAGFNLARQGRSVLFLERGPLRLTAHETDVAPVAAPAAASGERSMEQGWWPDPIYQRTEQGDASRTMPIGCGAGGSTALFAMVMDRFRPVDLTPRRFAAAVSGTSLPECWPITYEELEPYYTQAEALFRVRGTSDPLAPASDAVLIAPQAPSTAECALHDLLTRAGLHPYRLHEAREHIPGCNGCYTRLCARPCRNDAGRVCLLPALTRHGASILPECRVTRLQASGRRVRQACCVWRDREIAIRARVFVLALGSVLTPALLLRSADEAHPAGLGNSSGLVGRNLMLHVSDSVLVCVPGQTGLLNPCLTQGIALNDFYVRDETKLGSVHAHAALLPGGGTGSRGAVLFHTIVEDFPYTSNAVVPKARSDDAVVWTYETSRELRERSAALIAAFAGAVKGRAEAIPLHPPGSLNIAHACGTCRFGTDPRASVLDRDNRLHDLDNAYVVDASFLPSSGGIHPSLTIVANSLRASDRIACR